MRPAADVVLARARTLDEPRTARVLAEVARTRQELPRLGRRDARRPIARDEPFRKK